MIFCCKGISWKPKIKITLNWYVQNLAWLNLLVLFPIAALKGTALKPNLDMLFIQGLIDI